MASDNQVIRAAILNKLSGVGSLNVVYGGEQSVSSGQYPFATVELISGDAKFGDTARNIRTHKFSINIYQERTAAGFGNAKAENVILAICDEIETAFDLDTTLSGTCKWVRPLKLNASYVDRETGDTRVAQYTVEAVTIVLSQ